MCLVLSVMRIDAVIQVMEAVADVECPANTSKGKVYVTSREFHPTFIAK